MTATFSQAIRTARKRVTIVRYGRNDCTIQEYVPKYKSSIESYHMNFHRAKAARREDMIRIALELLGEEEADWLASMHVMDEGPWTSIVRDVRKMEGTNV